MTMHTKVDILYEDDSILAINKPAGLVVHADGRTQEANLTDWLLEKYPDIKNVGEPLTLSSGEVIYRPGIVHRLDRDTSGVMLVAKTHEAFEHLKAQFQDRDINKTYHAFVYGEIKEEDGVIDRPIARSRKDFRLWSAQRGARGEAREAITHFQVLKKHKGFTLVEAKPKTGRTHQIRVHFKAINHPIICDSLYAPKREPALGFARLALHSRSITFTSLAGEEKTVEAAYPEDFERAIAEFRK